MEKERETHGWREVRKRDVEVREYKCGKNTSEK